MKGSMNPQSLPSILIADDDDDDRFILQRALEKAGLPHPIRAFSDGDDLIEFLTRQSQEETRREDLSALLFLDLNMPRMTGFDVLAAMRRSGQANHLRTVVVSGSARDEDIDRAKQLGACEYLVKFPAPEILAKVVATVTSTSSLRFSDSRDSRPIETGRSDAA
jgi:CheY-like chemotaxis protein